MLKAVGLNDPYLALGKSFNQNHKPIIVGMQEFQYEIFSRSYPASYLSIVYENCSTINIGIKIRK